MDESDLRRLFEDHRTGGPAASPDEVRAWVRELLHLLFPEMTRVRPVDFDEFRSRWGSTRDRLLGILRPLGDTLPGDPVTLVDDLEAEIPGLRATLREDADA